MFSFFKKNNRAIKITDRIVTSATWKYTALLAEWNRNKNSVFVFWFDESLREAETFFTSIANESLPLYTAREAGTSHISGKTVVFAEHYPLRSKEEELYATLKLNTVVVFSSLNEPLFKKFGGDKIIQLMQQLGMNEGEVTEHAMISKAIRHAQEKVEKKIIVEQSARSQQDWLEKNLPD
jgi:hypothetical protein